MNGNKCLRQNEPQKGHKILIRPEYSLNSALVCQPELLNKYFTYEIIQSRVRR